MSDGVGQLARVLKDEHRKETERRHRRSAPDIGRVIKSDGEGKVKIRLHGRKKVIDEDDCEFVGVKAKKLEKGDQVYVTKVDDEYLVLGGRLGKGAADDIDEGLGIKIVGDENTIKIDVDVVPRLGADNAFKGVNTFDGKRLRQVGAGIDEDDAATIAQILSGSGTEVITGGWTFIPTGGGGSWTTADVVALRGSVFNVRYAEFASLVVGGDWTPAINAAIVAANAAGGGIVYLPPMAGGYGVTCDSTPVELLSNVTLLGSGWAGRIVRIGAYEHAVGRRLIRAAAVTNGVVHSTVQNLWVDGQGDEVVLAETELTVAMVGGDATINVVSTAGFPAAGRIKVAGVPITYSGLTATTFTGCVPSGAAAIPAAPIGTAVFESLGNLQSQCIRWEPLDEGEHHDHIRFQDNTIEDWPGAAVHLCDVEHFTVSGNVITDAKRGGIVFFTDCHHGTVDGNDVHSGDDCIAVQANNNVATVAKGTGPAYFTISGNTCESFGIGEQDTNNAMNIKGLAHSTIGVNTLIGAGESGGANKAALRVSTSDGVTDAARYDPKDLTIVGNTLYSPKDHGFYMSPDSTLTEPAQDIRFLDNTILDPGQRAIFLQGYVERLTIRGNTIENANAGAEAVYDAIWLVDAHDFVVADNHITGRDANARYGINIGAGCSDGEVHGNTCHDDQFDIRGFNNDSTTTKLSGNFPGAMGSIAATAATTLRDGYEFHLLTGTADVTSITIEPVGTRVVLTFGGTAATNGVVDGGNLKLAGNFLYTPNSTLELISDGTNWREIGRSLNGA